MKKRQKIFGSTAITIGLVFIIIIAINVIAAGLYFRLDITEENLYTLSEGTSKIVEDLKTPVVFKYYFSKSAGALPLVYKNYGKKIGELLQEYQAINSEMITLEVFDPRPDSDEEEWAKKYGLTGVDLSDGERLFMGMVIIQEDKEMSLPLMDPRREQFLEYDITQLLLQVYQKKEKKIGIMSSLPIMGATANRMQQLQGQKSQPKWVFIQELEKTFQISEVATSVEEIDESISILIVIHPKNLNDHALYAIDQFVLRGGELVVAVDPNARVDQTAAMMARMGQMGQANSNLDKLFKHWGIEYDANRMLGDKDRATMVNAGGSIGAVSFSLWHSLNESSFNQELIATKELDDMLLIEPGGFTVNDKSTLALTSLMQSSKNSGLVDNHMIRFGNPMSINKKVIPGGKAYTMAGILTGKLTSAFEQRPERKKTDEKDKGKEPDKKAESKTFSPHRAKSSENVKILMIADVDFIADQFAVEKFNVLGQVFSQPRNDNLNFMVNMVEFLGGAEAMMEIRTRGRFSRPFTRFLELEKNAQTKYQEAESRLSAKLREVQEKLSQLNVQKGTNKIVLTKDQIDKIKQFREEEKKNQSELRKIRKLLRQDIESEKTSLTMINLLTVPVLLAVFGLFLYYRRFRYKGD
ncbi:MAG: GldG family protein [Proteobacteria bacterium]|nr:GldG family protein [Pseudomonadota bacterium]